MIARGIAILTLHTIDKGPAHVLGAIGGGECLSPAIILISSAAGRNHQSTDTDCLPAVT